MSRRASAALFAALACAGLAASMWVVAHAVPLPRRLSEPSATMVRWADGVPAHASLAPDDRWRFATTPADVDPAYLRALVAFEDARFWWHPGVDPLAVVRAAGQDLLAGEVVSGASTLTMQLVRVVEPRPRTLRSKSVEVLRAVQLELRLGKEAVLGRYLTFAPYGRNVEGVVAGSWALFGHGPEDLTPAEIVTLLAIPQNPTRRTPSARNAARLRAARVRIASRLLEAGVLDVKPEAASAFLSHVATGPQPLALRPLPRDAAHAVRWLRPGPGSDITSTLDRHTQRIAEGVLAAERASLEAQGVRHAAVVVVDRETRGLQALVGGHDPFGSRPGDWLPAFAQSRSPGSTLKPFLLATALEQGLALPEHRVPDVPSIHGSYVPRNHDGHYRGTVRLGEALIQSLNAPFVDLLARVGVPHLVATLRMSGAHSLSRDPAAHGLSLAVGGTALTPLEVATLYTTLASGGRFAPLRAHADEPQVAPREALEPGAVWRVDALLGDPLRPDRPEGSEGIRWKTGTSQGHRDAWAAGYAGDRVVIVWLGNLDREASSALVGGELAAPLLFDTLRALGTEVPGSHAPTPSPPATLRSSPLCSLSGEPVGPHCPHTEMALVADSHPGTPCTWHRAVDVDVATGERVTPGCRGDRVLRREVHVVEPASVRRWKSRDHATAAEPLPALAEGCMAPPGPPPVIVEPPVGDVVWIASDAPLSEQERPLTADTRDGGTVWWTIDGDLVAWGAADQSAWWVPEPGRHEVVVTDAAGRSARRWVDVRVL